MENRKSPWKLYAEQVSAAAEILDSYCLEQNSPGPTADTTQSIPAAIPPSAPHDVLVAQQTILDSASKLQQLAIGPNGYLPHLALQVCSLESLECAFYPVSPIMLVETPYTEIPLSDQNL